MRKADGVVAKIDKITPDFVHLISAEDGASAKVFVNGKCSVIKGAVFKAMLDQYYEFKHEDAIQVFLKPSRDVKICKGFKCNQLRLPCATSRLEIKSPGDKVVQGALPLGNIKVANGKYLSMFMIPVVQMPKTDEVVGFVNPAWVMRSTTVHDEANMELSGSGHSGWQNQQPYNPFSKIPLPTIWNFKALSKGDFLVFYRPEAKSEDVKELQPFTKHRKS